jgi:secreted Zn-dependent insulinase-like peptidase
MNLNVLVTVHTLLLLPLTILQPKAYAYFELITPEVYSSPRAVAALKLFQMSVDDALSEYRQAY